MQGLPQRIGSYEVEGTLGQGGMGIVVRARHAQLGFVRALKVLTERSSPTGAARFAREVATLARVRHPNVVAIHEAGEVNGLPYYVMDLVAGEPLDRVLANGPLGLERAVELGLGVCRGVEALHAAGVVHRDLKPQNVMITADGRPVVIDLGLAIAPDRDQRLTRTGTMVGTPSYMAPEQVAGTPATPRTDVHALGLILFELLTGRVAFEGTSVLEVVGKIITPQRPLPSTLVPDLPAAVDAVVARAMHHDPAQRHADAGVLGAELEGLRGAQLAPGRRRLRRVAAVVVVLALGGSAVGVAGAAISSLPAAVAPVAPATPPPVRAAATPPVVVPEAIRLAIIDPPARPELPDVLREWSVVGPDVRTLTLRLDAGGGAVEVEHVHRAPTGPREVQRGAIAPGAPVELALETGWNEVIVRLRAPGAAGPISARRSIVRLPPGLAPVTASGPWIEVTRTQGPRPDRLVLVPPGRTIVARPSAESLVRAEADVPRPYLLGRFEVTLGQFEAACARGGVDPASADSGGAQPEGVDRSELPVVDIGPPLAADYCASNDLRLPTCEEWERAYTGGVPPRRYPWGDVWDPRRLNRQGSASERDVDGHVRAATVQSFPEGASLFGALNMAGNVSEFVGADDQDFLRRRSKYGGGFDTEDERLTWPGYRSYVDDTSGDWGIGFRVARSVDPAP